MPLLKKKREKVANRWNSLWRMNKKMKIKSMKGKFLEMMAVKGISRMIKY